MKQVKSKITKWLLILSWIFSLILIITPNIIRTSIYIIAMVALFAAAIVDYEKKKENYRSTYVSFEEVLAVLFIQAVMVWHFYVQWISSSEITMIAKIAHVSNKTLVVSVAICSAIVSSAFILIVSIVFRKFSFILNRLNCNVPVKPLHVKGACTELALDAAREHRYHQAGGK